MTADHKPFAAAEPGKLKKVRASELGVRFAFGAAVSIVAGLVGMAFGEKAGGMFLAFPAILPATLTLVEKKESTSAAVHAVSGAVIGGIGLVAFAVVVVVTAGRLPAGAVLGLATLAWAALSFSAYVVWEVSRRRARPTGSGAAPRKTGTRGGGRDGAPFGGTSAADVATTSPGL